tara:strand:+ start:250 stop:2337 length:2088 start_codon:yes stop_codon:yes gene_type:complete
MSNIKLHQAWQWSVEHSPMLNLVRWVTGITRKNDKAFALLDAAELPARVDALIRQTVSKSKLWTNERAEIARELIAHAQDAIEAGRTEEEIDNGFGDPKRIAKLMSRSMKRKRPLAWRSYRNMKRLAGSMALLVIVSYAALAVRYFTGSPSIKRNYIAELNAPNAVYREDQKAWKVYMDVELQWKRHVQPTQLAQKERYAKDVQDHDAKYTESNYPVVLDEDGENEYPLRPGIDLFFIHNDLTPEHPDYQETMALAKAFEPQLARVRQAASRPVLGVEYTDNVEQVEIEQGIWVYVSEPAAEDPEDQQSLIEVVLPHLGAMRKFAMHMVIDSRWAFEEGDVDRAAANSIAIAGLARHCMQDGYLISDLVGFVILDSGYESLSEQLRINPASLTKEQLVSIAYVYAIAGRELGLHLNTERMMFDDLLQRMYTDDGDGQGRMTPEGHELLLEVGGYASNRRKEFLFEDAWQTLGQPLGFVAGNRKSQHDQYHRAIDLIEQAAQGGPESIYLVQGLDIQVETENHRLDGYFISPVGVMLPAISHAVNNLFQIQLMHEGFMAMLAIETYRAEHGQLPRTLEQLAPGYLPKVPDDPFNPGHPMQYKVEKGGYVLYVAGADGDLDGGDEPDPEDHDRRSFFQRYSAKHSFIETPLGRVEFQIQRDEHGRVQFQEPQGPDSDWVLFDMRPKPKLKPDSESKD